MELGIDKKNDKINEKEINDLNLKKETIAGFKVNRSHLVLMCIMGLSIFLNIYNLGLLAFNTDEATYTSQSAIWAGHDEYRQNFIPYSRSATNFQIHQLITSVFFRAFGINEFVARLPVVIMGVISIFLIYLLACEFFTKRMALLSALFIGINGYSIHFNRQVNLDTPLVFFMILAIMFIVKWKKTKSQWYFYLFLMSIILAAMSKVIIIVPLSIVVFAYLYTEKDYGYALRMLFKPVSILIMIGALAYAYYFITTVIGIDDYMKTFIYASNRETQGSPGFYIKTVFLLLGYAFPIVTMAGLTIALKNRTEGDSLILLWFASILLFFTYYPLQGYNYIFPIIPPLCLLCGRAIDELADNIKKSNVATIVLSIVIILSIYPMFNVLNNPDKVVYPVAPVRFDSMKYGAIEDASLWLKDNARSDSKVAVYTFADSHVMAYYSGLKIYPIINYPGYYMPSDNGVNNGNAKIIWNSTDVIKMIEDQKMDYVVYMGEPRLSKNLTRLYEVEGLDFKLAYHKSYMTPSWYRKNLNISIYEVVKEKPVRMENINKSDFSIIVLPDAQTYSKLRPDIFKKQIEWIKENVDSLNIKFVVNVGSLVDTGNSIPQWNIVNKSVSMLDGYVPYLIVPGDHDYNGDVRLRDRTNFNTFFNYKRFVDYSWYGGHYPQDGNENNYGLFGGDGSGDFLILGLDFCPSDDDLAWADDIINKYSDRKVILFTYAYLNGNGERITFGRPNSCSNSGVKGNEGEDIYKKLIGNHQNIVLVLSGHKYGIGRRSDLVNGYTVNQVLQNYLTDVNGGNGYLRIFTFVPDVHRIDVKTFSPYLRQFNSSSDNEFNFTYN